MGSAQVKTKTTEVSSVESETMSETIDNLRNCAVSYERIDNSKKKIETKIENFQKHVSKIDRTIHEQWTYVSDVSKEIDDFVAKVTEMAEKKKEEMIQKVKML